jgi:hypothetical protein
MWLLHTQIVPLKSLLIRRWKPCLDLSYPVPWSKKCIIIARREKPRIEGGLNHWALMFVCYFTLLSVFVCLVSTCLVFYEPQRFTNSQQHTVCNKTSQQRNVCNSNNLWFFKKSLYLQLIWIVIWQLSDI